MLSAVHLADLIQRVEEQLGRFGIAGRVELDGTTLRLSGPGRSIAVAFTEVESWTNLPLDQQSRMLERIVREFVRLRRTGARPLPTRSPWLGWLRPLLVLALTIAGIALAWKWLGVPARNALNMQYSSPNGGATRSIAATVAPGSSPVQASEMCERVQSRIATGGTVSVLDVDGWVVELMLLSGAPELGPDSPKLDAFLTKRDSSAVRRLAWAEDEDLSSLDSPDTFVVVAREPLADVVTGTKSGVRITWSGKYVAKYFDEASRVRLQRLAAALYEATGASYGALYARCAIGANHQIGSWFRSRDLPSAILGVIAAMGLYAEMCHVNGADPRTASAIEQRRLWDSLIERAPKLDKQKLTLALSEDGGMIASRPGHWLTITFPFQDANRATRTSLRMTRLLGAAPRH